MLESHCGYSLGVETNESSMTTEIWALEVQVEVPGLQMIALKKGKNTLLLGAQEWKEPTMNQDFWIQTPASPLWTVTLRSNFWVSSFIHYLRTPLSFIHPSQWKPCYVLHTDMS